MPELPEIEVTRLGLTDLVLNKTVISVELGNRTLRKPIPIGFRNSVVSRKVTCLRRRAKYLLMDLSGGETIIVHFGMTGSLRIPDHSNPLPPVGQTLTSAHDHLRLTFEDGTSLVYNDPRRFGYVDLWSTDDLDLYEAFRNMGPEPLGNAFNAPALNAALSGKSGPIKTAILDQTAVAGLGNIYASEALFAAKISPRRKAAKLGTLRCDRLAEAIRTVIQDAIDEGIKTVLQNENGMDRSYSDGRFSVYGRSGETCEHCGGTIKQMVQAGRSTYYCSGCQR